MASWAALAKRTGVAPNAGIWSFSVRLGALRPTRFDLVINLKSGTALGRIAPRDMSGDERGEVSARFPAPFKLISKNPPSTVTTLPVMYREAFDASSRMA